MGYIYVGRELTFEYIYTVYKIINMTIYYDIKKNTSEVVH